MTIEDRVRQTLNGIATGVKPSSDAWASVLRRVSNQSHQGRIHKFTVVSVALALSATSLGVLWVAFESPNGQGVGSSSQQQRPHVAATITLTGAPVAVAAGSSGIWVSVPSDGSMSNDQLVRIDPTTNEVVASIPTDVPVTHVAVGPGAVWAVGADSQGPVLLQISPEENRIVARIPGVGAPIATDSLGNLWGSPVQDSGDALVKIDAATNSVTSTIPLKNSIYDIASSGDSVWVLTANSENATVGNDAELIRVDASTGRVIATIRFEASYVTLAAGPDIVWLPGSTASGSAAIRVDPRSDQIVGDPIPVASTFRPVAAVDGGAWFAAGPQPEKAGTGICRLNNETLAVDVCIDAGSIAEVLEPAVAYDAFLQTIWVANSTNTLTRLDNAVAP
jgi:hypothetical protein